MVNEKFFSLRNKDNTLEIKDDGESLHLIVGTGNDFDIFIVPKSKIQR